MINKCPSPFVMRAFCMPGKCCVNGHSYALLWSLLPVCFPLFKVLYGNIFLWSLVTFRSKTYFCNH